MSKNHLFLCCLNFLSFRLTSIYNRHHTKLNTLTKLFCDFFCYSFFFKYLYEDLVIIFKLERRMGLEPTILTLEGSYSTN